MDGETAKTGLAALGSLIAGLWANSAFRRRFSRDRAIVATDDAEVDLLTRLQNENKMLRERADQAFKERNDAVAELGGLRREVELLRANVATLEGQVERLQARIEAMIGGVGP